MNQAERRLFLIKYLLAESPRYSGTTIPADAEGQKILLRSLMNVREAAPASDEFYRIQDEYLQESIRDRGITDVADIESVGSFNLSRSALSASSMISFTKSG